MGEREMKMEVFGIHVSMINAMFVTDAHTDRKAHTHGGTEAPRELYVASDRR